jgi:hypothetical protein
LSGGRHLASPEFSPAERLPGFFRPISDLLPVDYCNAASRHQSGPGPLYQAWAVGGAGLIITGNVMVDNRAMTGSVGVALENNQHLDRFKHWASIGRFKGAQFWLQINHPGRQMRANLGQQTWAPSAVALDPGKMSKHFSTPLAMTEDMITEVIRRFARTARLGEQAGSTGVEFTRPTVPAEPVPVAAHQPENGSVGWLAGEPGLPAAGDRQGRSRRGVSVICGRRQAQLR